ncbi:MFS transporter [Amycolatopsis sp., V23-08]|uniref:MFS transporter n=1 Tax=Amycolatopsis heterodermiae TaxID=3110235 RepID=A0ABU5R8Q0_9PSEU|nr:MFS transporter [Amycolatopsis sp., V23-08]MEA5362618.1 MFS transporter [Amycolatopsis sp., V23-08]
MLSTRRVPRLLEPFGSRAFAQLWVSQVLSRVGDGIFSVTLVHVLVAERGSAVDFGALLAAQSLVGLLLLVYGGVVADRFKRTRVMAGADLLRGTAVLAMVFVPVDGPLWLWGVLTCVVGAGGGLFRPAYSAVVPTLLPERDLEAGNALRSIGSRAAMIAGPALGGLVVLVDSGLAFGLDAATFAVSLVMLLGIVEPALAAGGPRRNVAVEAWLAIRAVRERPWIAATICSGAVQILLVIAPLTVLLPLALHDRGQDGWFGFLTSTMAVGAVLGMVTAAPRRPARPGTTAMLGTLTLGLPLTCYLLPTPLWLLGGALFAAGYGSILFTVYWPSALQRAVPVNLRARVFALDELGAYLLQPVGLALTPLVVTAAGFRLPVVIAIAALAVTALLPLAVPGVARFSDVEGVRTEPGRGR